MRIYNVKGISPQNENHSVGSTKLNEWLGQSLPLIKHHLLGTAFSRSYPINGRKKKGDGPLPISHEARPKVSTKVDGYELHSHNNQCQKKDPITDSRHISIIVLRKGT